MIFHPLIRFNARIAEYSCGKDDIFAPLSGGVYWQGNNLDVSEKLHMFNHPWGGAIEMSLRV